MAKLVSNVYGDALFELAVESGKVDDFLNEAEAVIEVLETNDGFSQMMNHPKINKEEKLQIIDNVFKGKVSDELVTKKSAGPLLQHQQSLLKHRNQMSRSVCFKLPTMVHL